MINIKKIMESIDESDASKNYPKMKQRVYSKEDEAKAKQEMPLLVKELRAIATKAGGMLCNVGSYLALCFNPEKLKDRKAVAKAVTRTLEATVHDSQDGSWVYPGIAKIYSPYVIGYSGMTKGKETMEVEDDNDTIILKIYKLPAKIANP